MSGRDVRDTLGLLAVVAGLAFVGVEIQQNTRAIQGQTRQSILESDLIFLASPLDPATVLSATAKRSAGLELTLEEDYVLVQRAYVNLRLFENSYWQYQAGLLVEERWQTYRRIIGSLLSGNEHTQRAWERYRNGFDLEFQDEVAAALASRTGSPDETR